MSRRIPLALAAICLLGLALRLIGAGYGLPAIYNQDEVAIMNRAMALSQDLNPHNFLYPTLYFYALFAWETLFFAVGHVFGLFPSVAAFQREFFVDPSRIYLAGRVLTALLGTLTIWAVYRLGARLADRATGLAAALLMAVAPFAVRDAHYVKHDVPVTLLVVATHVVLAALLMDDVRRQRTRSWILAGALAGLAMSTHYYAVFVVLPIALVALLPSDAKEPWRTRLTRLAIAGIAATLAFLATSPFILVEPASFWRDVVGNREIVMDRAVGGSGAFGSWPAYMRMLFGDAAGWPVFAVAIFGAVLALASHWRRGLLLLAFPVPFLLFIANTVPASRYLNPILPFVALLAANAVVWVGGWFGRHSARVITAATVAVAVPGLLLSWNTGWFFRQTDTRTLAQRYIEREIPVSASLLSQPYSVPLRRSRESLIEALRAHGFSETSAPIKFRSQLALDPYPAPAYRVPFLGKPPTDPTRDPDIMYVDPAAFDASTGLAPLRALGIDYVILKKRYNASDSSSFELALIREGHLLETFSPYRQRGPADRVATVAPFVHNTDARIDTALERPGPIVEIWRIR